jgi:hypothetical protein
VWQRHRIRLRRSILAPSPPEVSHDILVSDHPSRIEVRSAARDGAEDMQAILDILDRAIVRELIEEVPHELLGRDRYHRSSVARATMDVAPGVAGPGRGRAAVLQAASGPRAPVGAR